MTGGMGKGGQEKGGKEGRRGNGGGKIFPRAGGGRAGVVKRRGKCMHVRPIALPHPPSPAGGKMAATFVAPSPPRKDYSGPRPLFNFGVNSIVNYTHQPADPRPRSASATASRIPLVPLTTQANTLYKPPVATHGDLAMLRVLLIFVLATTTAATCTSNGDDKITCTSLPSHNFEWGSQYTDDNVSILDLGQTGSIDVIPDYAFGVGFPYPAAKKLYLWHNNITTIGTEAFLALTELEELHLNDNDITWMAEGSLNGLSSLIRLTLADNNLGEFDFGSLRGMSLERFDIDGNGADVLECNGVSVDSGPTPGVNMATAEILAAIAECVSLGSPCFSCAVGCPANTPSTPGDCPTPMCTDQPSGVDCTGGFIALPAGDEWGGFSVTAITGTLDLEGQYIAAILDNGFDNCPYTAATQLNMNSNGITTVGARAFATLAALEILRLQSNTITWMAATSLDGVIRLEQLYLDNNYLANFDYGALAQMTELETLFLSNQWRCGEAYCDLSCGGVNYWGFAEFAIIPDRNGIAAAVASCGATGSPCAECAVGCPANLTSTGTECVGSCVYVAPDDVECTGLIAVPIALQWGGHNATEITGDLSLRQEIDAIPDDGFDGCPYTAATGLYLDHNNITTVGSWAFSSLSALKTLSLSDNQITYLSPASLAGPSLTTLLLDNNEFGEFNFNALRLHTISTLELDVECNGVSTWTDNTGVLAAIASCDGNPCSDCAVGCLNVSLPTRRCELPPLTAARSCPGGNVREYKYEEDSGWYTECAGAVGCAAATPVFKWCTSVGKCYGFAFENATNCLLPPLPPAARVFPDYEAAAEAEPTAAPLDGAAIGVIVSASVVAVVLIALLYVQRERLYTRLQI